LESYRAQYQTYGTPEDRQRFEEQEQRADRYREEARPAMRAFVHQQVDWLERRAADLESQPDPGHLAALLLAEFDAGAATGAPLRRYENMATRQLHKAL